MLFWRLWVQNNSSHPFIVWIFSLQKIFRNVAFWNVIFQSGCRLNKTFRWRRTVTHIKEIYIKYIIIYDKERNLYIFEFLNEMQRKCSSVITDTFEPTGARLSFYSFFSFSFCANHSIPFYLRHFKSPHFSLFLILILFLSRLQIKQQNKKRKKCLESLTDIARKIKVCKVEGI